jgi:hypothetical protein
MQVSLTQAELVLTMYEKGGRKIGQHSWTKECRNIGLLSYIVVQVWRQSLGQRCQFKTVHGPSSHISKITGSSPSGFRLFTFSGPSGPSSQTFSLTAETFTPF